MSQIFRLMKKEKKLEHICTVPDVSSYSFLPPLPPHASRLTRLTRMFKHSTLISERNPRTTEYYRSGAEVLSLRKEQVLTRSCIIHPFSMFRLYYEMYMCLVFILCLIYMPLTAVFETSPTKSEQQWSTSVSRYINLFFDLACLADIVMWFFTGYANDREKVVEMNPKKIAKQYIFFGHFLADVISSVPEPIFFTDDWHTIRAFDILGLLKSTRIMTTYYYVNRTADFFGIKNKYFWICVHVFFTFLVFHWCSCLFILVPQIRIFIDGRIHPSSWLHTWHLIDDEYELVSTVYIKSFYKVSGYLLGVQYTSKMPITWDEKVVGCIVHFSGKIFMLYITVILVNKLLSTRSLETKYFEIMSQVEGFMDRKRLNPAMRHRIMQNYVYKYNMMFIQENKITEQLSDHVKREINAELLHKMVANVKIFEELIVPELELVLAHLKSEVFLPSDIIIKHGTTADCMYFLATGTVTVSTPSGKEVCHLQDGDYFGEICMLYRDKKRTANVIALEICEVYKMSKRGFSICFKNNKTFLNKLILIAKERMEITEVYEEIQLRAHHQESTRNMKISVVGT